MTDKTDKIFEQTSHRQYELPDEPWKYYQEWHNVLMLPYHADSERLLALIPNDLSLDTHEGVAWVSLFAFSVKKLRPRFLPALPGASSFTEINLRTYVMRNGIPGIFMLSIEADKLIDVIIPRLLLGVPYTKTNVRNREGYFFSKNKKGQTLKVDFLPQKPVEPKTELDYWLTERHALYVKRKEKLYRFDIHHKEWKLRNVSIFRINENYTSGIGISLAPTLRHYTKRINVVVWGRRVVG